MDTPIADSSGRRLIEEWLPVNELSIESIRERAAPSALPPINWLHVWWARRPLIMSRAAVAASLLPASSDYGEFYDLMGTHTALVEEQRRLDAAKILGVQLKIGHSRKRAFTNSPTETQKQRFRDSLAVRDPLVLDITAGGGSIPFETGRLGLRYHANDLNPVATLILRASCEWPQRFGEDLLTHYDEIQPRFQGLVEELLADVYPAEPLPRDLEEYNRKYAVEIEKSLTERAQRYVWADLWARTVHCPSCRNLIPLSPNWRLDSNGKGIRIVPDEYAGKCEFEIVETTSEQSPATIKNGVATCPYPSCGASTPKGYVGQEAQAGRMGQQFYCVIYRDQWRPKTKSGRFSKRLKTRRGYRTPRPDDDITAGVLRRLDELRLEWDANDNLPNEGVPDGNKTRELHRYGMSEWRKMFSPRQQLAHGYCVQAFRELVEQDRDARILDETRKAAWCYIALGLDKLLNRNTLLTRWDSGSTKVAGTFDSHDFGMKWSFAEMSVTKRGTGLEWALNDLRDCINELVKMSGYPPAAQQSSLPFVESAKIDPTTQPSVITCESADLLLSLDDQSVEAIVFDPPYYDNVDYAELSDFFYVWLKRTAGYIHPEWFGDYLTDKTNEAIASPSRFRNVRGRGSVKSRAYKDYAERMRRIFSECRRVIRDDGILTIMFTHKSTDAWDALTIGIIESGFRITATWSVKSESDVALNIRDRAAARSTVLLACRPKIEQTASSASWEQVERQIEDAVRERLPQLEQHDLKPLDIYLASFGPALEVISSNWPIRRELANPDRPDDAFAVTPNDALQVARREVFAARRQRISDLWASNPGDPLTEFYILAQDTAGSATIPFDEANLMARCIGLELSKDAFGSICEKNGSNINLLTGVDRFERGLVSRSAPTSRGIDRVHTAIGLANSTDVNYAINWCEQQGFRDDPAFRGTLQALLRTIKMSDPDRVPASTLWSEMYDEVPPEPETVQVELLGL